MILLFLLLSLAAVIIYVHFAGFVMWKTLLLFAGCFIALNVLFLLFWAVVAIFVSTAKPITKQSGICRLGCISVSSVMCGYAWVRTHIHGMDKLPTGERFLFVCNHRSMFDPLIVMSKLRDYNISFISKPSNMRIPIVGRVSYGAGFLPIDRENNRNALKTILTAADLGPILGITQRSTRRILQRLFELGLIRVLPESGSTGRGRPVHRYVFVKEAMDHSLA